MADSPFPLQHFGADEFEHPDRMNVEFLHFLDRVRDDVKFPFRLTSDFRTPEANAAAIGSAATSLHLSGNAVDFTTPGSATRDAQRFYAELYVIARAVMVRQTQLPMRRNVQLEFTKGPLDWHIHLGLYPP